MKRLLRLPLEPDENEINLNPPQEVQPSIIIKPLKNQKMKPKAKAKSKPKAKAPMMKSKPKAQAKSKPKAKAQAKSKAKAPMMKPKVKSKSMSLNNWYSMDKPMGNPFFTVDPLHSSPAQGFLHHRKLGYDHMGVLHETHKPVIKGDDQNFNSYGDVRYDNLIAPVFRPDGVYEEGNRFNLFYDGANPFYMKKHSQNFMKGGGYAPNFRFEENNVPMKVGAQGVIEGKYVLK